LAGRGVVLDTSVIATAIRSRNGASYALLNFVAERLLTPALFVQYEDVLKRPEQLSASRLTAEVDQRLAAIALVAKSVTVHFLWRPQPPDSWG
jgi:hypothetical protein